MKFCHNEVFTKWKLIAKIMFVGYEGIVVKRKEVLIMNKSTIEAYNNIFIAILYVIVALVVCTFVMGTAIMKVALGLAVAAFLTVLTMFIIQRVKESHSKEENLELSAK